MNKTAQEPPEMPAGTYGASSYNPGIDDPTALPPQFYNPPQWDPYAWPKWALPTSLIASGLLGFFGLRGLARRLGRAAPGVAARATPAAGATRVVTAAAMSPQLAEVIQGIAAALRSA